MTNNKPNDVRVVSVELLEEIISNLSFCGARHKLAEILAQPADQQGEPVTCTSCDGSGEYIDALGDWRGYCCCPPGIELKARHAQPATNTALPNDWRSLADMMQSIGAAYWLAAVQERGSGAVQWLHNEDTGAMFVFTRGEYAEQLKQFVCSLDDPATAKVDENTEFEIWRNDQIESLERMGYQDAAKAFRNLGSVHWTGWQARANLNGTSKVVLPERMPTGNITTPHHDWSPGVREGWNACLDEVTKLNTPQ